MTNEELSTAVDELFTRLNGLSTHEWRIRQLETQMEKLYSRLNAIVLLLVSNLVGLVTATVLLLLKVQ